MGISPEHDTVLSFRAGASIFVETLRWRNKPVFVETVLIRFRLSLVESGMERPAFIEIFLRMGVFASVGRIGRCL
jgi:hypothetical protein